MPSRKQTMHDFLQLNFHSSLRGKEPDGTYSALCNVCSLYFFINKKTVWERERERERYDNQKIWRSSNQTETSRWSVTGIQLSWATPSLALLPPTGDQSGRTDDGDRHPIRFDDMFIRTRCRSLFKLACDKQQKRQRTGKKERKKEEKAKRSYSLAMSHAKRKHKWFTNNTYNVEHKNAKTRRSTKKETENKTTTTKTGKDWKGEVEN